MSDADWEPLPKEQLCGNPGEFVALGKRPVAPAAPSPAVAAPPAPVPAAPAPAAVDPAAERALQDLQQKLAVSQPAASWVAHSLQKQRRVREKRAREPKTAALAEAVITATGPAAVVAIDERASNLDARELEPWFKELPAREQERLRQRWWEERERFAHEGQRWQRRMLRALGHGALVMGLLGILQSLLLGNLFLVPTMAAAGAMAAGLAEMFRGDRFVYALCGALGWVLVMGEVVLQQPFAMPGLLMAAYGMGAVGMEGEMRRSGGFRDG